MVNHRNSNPVYNCMSTETRMTKKNSRMRPKFWYCPFCGYMFMDTGKGSLNDMCCPMCGEEVMPCWKCIAKGEFDTTLCRKCENKADCQARFAAKNLPFAL